MPCSTRAADAEHLPRSLFLKFERSGFSSPGRAQQAACTDLHQTYLDSAPRKRAGGINNAAVLATAMGITGRVSFVFSQQCLTCVSCFGLFRWICSCRHHASRRSEDENYVGKGKSGGEQQTCQGHGHSRKKSST